MISFYKTVDNRVTCLDAYEEGCWISAVSPSEQEVSYLVNEVGAERGFVSAALDEEESSRIEREEDQTLIIVDVPVTEDQEDGTQIYTTMPMGIIITPTDLITVLLRENGIISDMTDGRIKGLKTQLKTRMLLLVLLRVAARFLQYLKQIDRISSATEKQLHKSMKNQELIQLLGLEKSLVYFSTSLKSNEITLEKILRGRFIRLYDEDQDLLEDVLIEVKQAIEMCNIYSSILSGTMDAFASIISNNLNIVMKILASLTIVMAIPTIVSSFYGMNVVDMPLPYFWAPFTISIVLTLTATLILVRKGMFH